MVQVLRVPDYTPRIRGVVVPPSDDDGLVATAFTAPNPIEGATVLSVVLPQGGSTPSSGTLDPVYKAALEAKQAEQDDRLDDLENSPPPAPSGPAGGDLAGFYPNPTLAQSYALSGPTTSALSGKANRRTVRGVSTSVTAQVGELLRVGTGTSTITIAPPPNPQPGDQIEIIKVDAGSGRVVFNGDTNSDATAEFVGQWSGATLVYTGPTWVVASVAVSYSAPPSQSGGGSSNLNREQADARYDPIGAATAAVQGINKASLGLGNVENTSDANKPISAATQAALNAKAPLVAPYTQTAGGTYTVNAANGPVQAITANGNLTLQPPSNPTDMQTLRLHVYASGGSRTVTTFSSISNGSGQPLPFTVGAGRFAVLGLAYDARATRWLLLSYVVEPGA